jgi:hypothetical protein
VGNAWIVTVTNNGPSDARSVIVVDVLPSVFTYGQPSSGACGVTGNVLTCSYPYFARGTVQTFSIPFTAAATLPRRPGAELCQREQLGDQRPQPAEQRQLHRRPGGAAGNAEHRQDVARNTMRRNDVPPERSALW